MTTMKLAMVFPGQGSQSVGMLNAWGDNPAVQQVMAQADQALGEPLSALIAHGPAEQLNATTHTQPAMLAASYAMYSAYVAQGGPRPSVVAGHSLGEYTALLVAGVFSLADALRLVRIRADAMQVAVPLGTGGMAAILGLSDDSVNAICAQAAQEEVVEPVNFNAPAQVVIAGHTSAVARACELAKAQGAKRALPLPVSAPFHSRLLAPAAQVLQQALEAIPSFSHPSMALINNVDVAVCYDPQLIKDALMRQAWHPVRWVETVQKMQADGVTHIVECGPGKVLSGLVKRIAPDIPVFSIYDPASLQATLAALQA